MIKRPDLHTACIGGDDELDALAVANALACDDAISMPVCDNSCPGQSSYYPSNGEGRSIAKGDDELMVATGAGSYDPRHWEEPIKRR